MKYLSLFSGIGGFELGIGDKAECVGFSEIDKYATQIYKKHFNHKKYGDITTINTSELPDFDLLVGGFPCQSFSVAGKRKGFEDTRGTLFFEIARILSDKRPRLVLLENVKGLLSHDSGKTFQTIIKVLTDIGYRVEWQVLNSKDFGVPQNRERVFIVGHLDHCERLVFPVQYKYARNYNEKMYWLSKDVSSYCREFLLRIPQIKGKEISTAEMQELLERVEQEVSQGKSIEVERKPESLRPESEGDIQKIKTLEAFLESSDDSRAICGLVQEPTEEMLLLWHTRNEVKNNQRQLQQQNIPTDYRQNELLEKLRNNKHLPLLFAVQPYQGKLFFSIGDGEDWQNIYIKEVEAKCNPTLSSILEETVDEKYFLSDKATNKLLAKL